MRLNMFPPAFWPTVLCPEIHWHFVFTLKRGHKPFMQLFDIVNALSHTTFTSGHIVNQKTEKEMKGENERGHKPFMQLFDIVNTF